MEGQPIGPILLKLRFLASRLGSNLLEEWVKHESEGYPADADLPDYRKVSVSYVGTFTGAFGAGIRNAPIPPYLIEQYAGKHWTKYEIRQGVASIDELIASSAKGSGSLQINAANLILLLQGNIYEKYACNSVTGTLSAAALVEVQNAIRARVLELTIQIEKTVPASAEIAIGVTKAATGPKDTDVVTQITNQVIHGNYTSISNSGDGAQFNLNINGSDTSSVSKALEDVGMSSDDAKDIAKIFASEKPESKQEPFGHQAKQWIANNIKKAADGTWKMGVAVATKVLTEAALKYYGLK